MHKGALVSLITVFVPPAWALGLSRAVVAHHLLCVWMEAASKTWVASGHKAGPRLYRCPPSCSARQVRKARPTVCPEPR